MTQDHYETLQVHPRADAAAIEAAYARMRQLYDPARLDGAADELVALAREKRETIERAYAVLSDPARRATYDAEVVTHKSDQRPTTNDRRGQEGVVRRSSFVVRQDGEEPLDYRPLEPARRAERPRSFNAEPVRGVTAGRQPGATTARGWAVPVGLAGVVVLIVAISLALTGGGGPAPALVTPTPSTFDQFEQLIPQAQRAAEQNPTNAQAWIDYGNVLYDSVQIVRESAPDSPLYQQRLGRWLQATEAYSQGLALQPDNASARADMGASACFYGAGTGDQEFVRLGTSEVRRAAQAAPDDPRVLLSLGHCLISAQPPQTAEALDSWRRIVNLNPSSSLAQQAQLLIAKYSQ
jgi:tetratricopeptide (TPR) repeat protein